MTDARFPDRWLTDFRVLSLTDSEFRSFVVSLVWAVNNRTDGRVESEHLAVMQSFRRESIPAFVRVGLWTVDGRAWQIKDFEVTQTTSAQLASAEHARAQNRDRQKSHRARKSDPEPDSPDVTRYVTRDVTRDNTGQASARLGQDVSTLTEPVPNVKVWPEVNTPGKEVDRPPAAPIPRNQPGPRRCPDCGAEVPPGHVKCQPCMRAARKSA